MNDLIRVLFWLFQGNPLAGEGAWGPEGRPYRYHHVYMKDHAPALSLRKVYPNRILREFWFEKERSSPDRVEGDTV